MVWCFFQTSLHIFVTHKSVVHFNSSPIAGFALNRGKMELQSAKSAGWEQKRPNMKKDFQLWRRDSANGFWEAIGRRMDGPETLRWTRDILVSFDFVGNSHPLWSNKIYREWWHTHHQSNCEDLIRAPLELGSAAKGRAECFCHHKLFSQKVWPEAFKA